MSAPGLAPSGRAAVEAELLAQLGLPTSAAPEDVDQLHQAASEFLATAPASLRGWAHAQAAALDAAYLNLTDPAGFGGSTLRSPSRPPVVVPGGPATPPARRASRPAATPEPATPDADEADDLDDVDEDEDVDLDDLYASVTPSAHSDMRGDRKARTTRPVPSAAAAPAAANPWKRLVIGGGVLALAAVLAIGAYVIGGSGNGGTAVVTPAPSASGPSVDLAKVGALMQTLQASPKDTVTLLALGDEYYAGQDFTTAASFYDKVLAIDAKNVKALLARGAVSFNLGDLPTAQTTWQQVVTLDPTNQEVYYDLGFLALNQASPDWRGVQREWTKVIALDSTSDLAQLVQQHLDSLVAASMIPASPAAGSPAASGSASPVASPVVSPSTSPAASPAASAAPSASPAASTQP